MIKFIKKFWNRGQLIPTEDINRWEDGIADAVDALNEHNSNNTRHITQAERESWDGRAQGTHTHTIAQVSDLQSQLNNRSLTSHTHANVTTATHGFMSSADKSKLDGIANNANNFVHPTGDGNLHVPATGTENNNRVLRAGATAGSLTWGSISWNDLTNRPDSIVPSEHTHNANDITTGTFHLDRIPSLPAARINSGTFEVARVPNLPADRIASGTLATDRIPTGISITGNAATATTMQTTRQINGTNFNGSANITTANWGMARNIQIGNTTKSVNGSTNAIWSLGDIGAAASNHTNTFNDLRFSGNLSGTLDLNTLIWPNANGAVYQVFNSNTAGEMDNIINRPPAPYISVSSTLEVQHIQRNSMTDWTTIQTLAASNGQIWRRWIASSNFGTWQLIFNGTNGNARVTRAELLHTARNITVGNHTMSFNGGSNISATLAQIGAAPTAHTHTIAQVTNLQAELNNRALSAHNHNASQINAGTLAIARLPTGTTATTVATGNHSHHASSLTGATPSSSASGGQADIGNLCIVWWRTTTASMVAGNWVQNTVNFGVTYAHPPNVQAIAGSTNFTCAIGAVTTTNVTINTRHTTTNTAAASTVVSWVAIGRRA